MGQVLETGSRAGLEPCQEKLLLLRVREQVCSAMHHVLDLCGAGMRARAVLRGVLSSAATQGAVLRKA